MIGQEKARLDSTALDLEDVKIDPLTHSAPSRIAFLDCPFPCSENAMYRNLPNVGRVATQKLRDFKSAFAAWSMVNAEGIRRSILRLPKGPLRFNMILVCSKKRIFTKDGRIKKIDPHNYLKPMCDSIASVLHIDDSVYFRTTAEKALSVDDTERAMVVLSQGYVRQIPTVEQIMEASDSFYNIISELDDFDTPESL